jgi:hypothetical protein
MTDAGGSNATRARLWRVGVQRLANLTGLHIHVSHFPPGNQQVEQERAPDVLLHHQKLAGKTVTQLSKLIVDLIANPKTTTGPKIKANLTRGMYSTGGANYLHQKWPN